MPQSSINLAEKTITRLAVCGLVIPTLSSRWVPCLGFHAPFIRHSREVCHPPANPGSLLITSRIITAASNRTRQEITITCMPGPGCPRQAPDKRPISSAWLGNRRMNIQHALARRLPCDGTSVNPPHQPAPPFIRRLLRTRQQSCLQGHPAQNPSLAQRCQTGSWGKSSKHQYIHLANLAPCCAMITCNALSITVFSRLARRQIFRHLVPPMFTSFALEVVLRPGHQFFNVDIVHFRQTLQKDFGHLAQLLGVIDDV